MTNSSSDRPGEFELIAKLFAPLAGPGGYALTDDAATVLPKTEEDLVITADLLSESIHFRSEDSPDLIAKKALRVNLSDLAAKGAVPHGYLLSLALPKNWTLPWLESFARGLEEDQRDFSCLLLGGDTTTTNGPLTIAITALGFVPTGTMIRRSGAMPGDIVFASGTIGDAGAGLAVLNAGVGHSRDNAFLVRRYQVPSPRLSVGAALRGVANAALDISDGLIADLGHISETSRVGISIDAARIPRSAALENLKGHSIEAIAAAATAGDDYEIAFTAPALYREAIARIAQQTEVPITEIGRVEQGAGVRLLDSSGAEIPVSRSGYRHF